MGSDRGMGLAELPHASRVGAFLHRSQVQGTPPVALVFG